MKKKYLIALDMDGTLLDDQKQISAKTISYLKSLENKGHIVVIASGRPVRSILGYYNELELKSPIVCYNGANIIAPNDQNFREVSFAFPRQMIKELYEKLKDKYIDNVFCETNKEFWHIKEDPAIEQYFWTKDMTIHSGNINQTLNSDPMTMIMKSKDVSMNPYIIQTIQEYADLKIRFWAGLDNLYSEIFFSHVSKAAALKYIAKQYNLDTKDIIAFGDADNDLEMFEEAGISVAMLNAMDNIKKHATMVSVADNNHDGVMKTLKIILKN